MRHLTAVLVGLTLAGSDLHAQASYHPPARFSFGFRVPVGHARAAAICDGSEMASVHKRRSLGKVLAIGGLAVDVLGPALAQGGGASALPIITAGTAASLVGFYLRYNSNPSDGFWQNSIAQIKTGETRAEEVRQCFGPPAGTTISDADQMWTYNATNVGWFGMGGSSRSVSMTLKNGLVTKVQKSEFGF